jgi:hypothetical protein
MNKEEILSMAQEDNKGMDVADLEAQKSASIIGYYVVALGILIVTIVDKLVLNKFDFGAVAVCLLMFAVAFLVKYIKLKRKHELFVFVIYLLGSIFGLVCWILELTRVW